MVDLRQIACFSEASSIRLMVDLRQIACFSEASSIRIATSRLAQYSVSHRRASLLHSTSSCLRSTLLLRLARTCSARLLEISST
jgi:hypothetical protein